MIPLRRIAIVDDNALVRSFVSLLLKSKNYNIVFQAVDGQDCIDQLGQEAKLPDLIILDIEMPRKDGFDTAPIIKSRWPWIRIIAMSARDDKETAERIINAGADRFLSKGENINEELLPILDMLLH